MRYYRVHTADQAWLTKQPRGIFTTVGKLVDAGVLSEAETEEYWNNRRYFEDVLPVPPFYDIRGSALSFGMHRYSGRNHL